MKFLSLFLTLTLTESQFVIRPEDLTAGLEEQALLVCAAKSGGKFLWKSMFRKKGQLHEIKKVEHSITLIELAWPKYGSSLTPAESMRKNLFQL